MARIIVQSNDKETVFAIQVDSGKTLDNPLGSELLTQEIIEKLEEVLLSEI